MGIDGNGGMPPIHLQHHVRGLSTHAGQAFQRRAVFGHFAAEVINQYPRGLHHVRGFGVVEADGLDVVFQRVFAQVQHLLGRCYLGEQGFGRGIDGNVGGLR